MNTVPDRERMVSIVDVEVPLTIDALREFLEGREAYRHTRYLVARHEGEVALLEVTTASREMLFSPIVAVQMVATPDETRLVVAHEVDVAIPSDLAAAAAALAADARCVVVTGRYEHLGFILDPRPARLRVVDVVPPEPAKLVDQLERVLAVTEHLPPVELETTLVDAVELAANAGTEATTDDGVDIPTVLFPCQASGSIVAGRTTRFLDRRPPREPWLLVGCARSREIHRWFYGDEPPMQELCPRRHVPDDGVTTLVRCCLLDDGIQRDGATVVVPWGATLEEVRRGLEAALDPDGATCRPG